MDTFDLKRWSSFHECCNNSLDCETLIDQISIDSRRISSPRALFVALKGEQSDGHHYLSHAENAGARFALVKKDHPLPPLKHLICLKVDDPLQALQEIASIYRSEKKAKVIAVTGSFGKTMLKDLLSQILKIRYSTFASPESFNSQLGVPLSLLMIQDHHEAAIIEAGVSKPNEMTILSRLIRPDHSIVLNIGNAHLDTMGSTETIAKEKLKLIQDLDPNNWCLLPKHPLIHSHSHQTAFIWNEEYPDLPHVRQISRQDEITLSYEVIFPTQERYVGKIVHGFFYHIDLLNAALKAAWLLGINAPSIIEYLKQYTPEPMRIEIWRTMSDATIINDTYSEDPMSVDLALKRLSTFSSLHPKGNKIVVFGGLKNQCHNVESSLKRIGHSIGKTQLDILALTQDSYSPILIEEALSLSPKTVIQRYESVSHALSELSQIIGPKDTIVIKNHSKVRIEDAMLALEGSIPHNQIIINLAAIRSNLSAIQARIGSSQRIMVMVKALAYGTDDTQMASYLRSCGIDILGVSYVDEAIALRKGGYIQDIFVLNAAPYELEKAVKWEFEIGVSDSCLIEKLQKEAARQSKYIRVHLHIDTGMARFGCRPEKAVELANLIGSSPNLIFEGIFTHFASADDPSQDEFTHSQVGRFEQCLAQIRSQGHNPIWIHACNSAAAIRFGFPQFNMVRLGLAVYGLHTSPATHGLVNIQPAFSLISRIVGINECTRGETVSYGRNYVIDSDTTRIGVLPIGYFDGLHRHFSGKGQVMIRGIKAPMVGNICMDYMMVDLTHIPLAEVGDAVLIFGEDLTGQYISIEEFAQKGGSIAHELMTCLGPRIQRLFIYDESLRSR